MNWLFNRMLSRRFECVISRTGKSKEDGHYGTCSGWYFYWFITDYMLASVGLDIDMRVWLVRVEGVHE